MNSVSKADPFDRAPLRRGPVVLALALALALSLTLVQCSGPATGVKDDEHPKAGPAAQEAEQPQPERKPDMASKATIPERSSIDDKYKWNTAHVFSSDTAWEKERKALVASYAAIAKCKGTLKRGKKVVLACLKLTFAARQRLEMLANYSHRKHDVDTRVAKYQGYKQVTEKVATEFAETTSFLDPELLALPGAKLKAMITDKTFADYSQYLREILRLKPHILSPKEEALLASASLMRDAGYNTYSTFAGADLKFPRIKDETGAEVDLSQALFTRYRSNPNRRVRKAAFDAFFGTYKNYRNTLASLLASQVNANIVYAKAKRYGSAVEASLDANKIPVAVYKNMIKAVNKHLPMLHRYLKLRQQLLGLKDLRYYDMYPPIVKKVDLKFSYEQGRALLVDALAPMGPDYVKVLGQGLDPKRGWVDVYPTKGKRSGAYMDGSAYSVHPYVLLNYLDNYDSVSTTAHEMGHALHSYLSNKSQPFAKADYSIFVAEVASTLNEALLMDHMLKKVEDPRERLFLLGQKLEDFRQTIFRQTMFAEFELALYQRAEKKEPLTADSISKIYLEIVRRYYGHKKGVVLVDELYGMEWAYVPHFYYNFYVFQYVTGMTAAVALGQMIIKEGAKPRDRYVKHMLKAGGSDYPITLLKRAGVDLTSTAPYDIAMADFKDALVKAEALVKQLKK
jgi:oligoendopeptidase F